MVSTPLGQAGGGVPYVRKEQGELREPPEKTGSAPCRPPRSQALENSYLGPLGAVWNLASFELLLINVLGEPCVGFTPDR